MKALADNSVDAVVTDPPYGLSFMNKKWDYDVPSVEIWREVLRVLKPGGHILSFGGTRTYHRMAVNIEDAGFEIRDQVQWLYGSGFPKSHNVSKSINKMKGVERTEFTETPIAYPDSDCWSTPNKNKGSTSTIWSEDSGEFGKGGSVKKSLPATPEAKTWDGWGSALKPANEPICLARKPLEKGLTLAQNVLKWGTGAINVDGSRIASGGEHKRPPMPSNNENQIYEGKGYRTPFVPTNAEGRWPANVLFDEEAAEMLDEQSGKLKNGGGNSNSQDVQGMFGNRKSGNTKFAGDSGGASRFFYVAKASKRERNAGLEGMPEKFTQTMNGGIGGIGGREHNSEEPTAYNENFHPTVKPIKLMEYLITLITPPNGTALDPFMGSGSTGVAAKSLSREFIGIECDPEYFKIAERRIANSTETQLKLKSTAADAL